MDVQFEWNKISLAAEETEFPHCKMWLENDSAIILNI